jgi:hypothetical protein
MIPDKKPELNKKKSLNTEIKKKYRYFTLKYRYFLSDQKIVIMVVYY